jgi:hypothetical protein
MNAMLSPKMIFPRIIQLLILLTLSTVGCSDVRQGEHPLADSPEASLAEQTQAVRDGRSTALRLDRTLVVDRDLDSLAGLESQLLRVNFSRSEITDAGLAKLCQMKNLEQLRLASPRITDAGIASVGQLARLRFLHLIDAPITDAGIELLYGLKNLESLYLDGTKVTDEGIARLVAALPQVHLHIDDHHHRLDPHGADHTH